VLHRLRRRPYLVNAALALLLLALSAPQARPTNAGDVTELAVYWAFAALSAAGLLIQHRWPLYAVGLTVAGAAGHALVRDWNAAQIGFPTLIELAVPITLYTLASRGPSRRLSAAVLLLLVAAEIAVSLVNPITLGRGGPPPGTVANIPADRTSSRPEGILYKVVEPGLTELLALALAYALGEGTRSRQAHLRTLQQRAADAERVQRQRLALATASERARIGREMHDVIAHSLTVIVAQAQAAIAAQPRHPQRATDAMREVISVGRDSLSEMRRLVGAFRPAPDLELELAPPAGIGGLPALIERIRAAGLPVHLTIDGSPANLPASVDLSAYRIVQEALTNTLKHAGAGTEATVRLTLHPDHVDVDVTDDGAGASVDGGACAAAPPADHGAGLSADDGAGRPADDGAGLSADDGEGSSADEGEAHGNGLRGIAERVELLGGTLSVGLGPDGGFAIRAQLPIAPAGVPR
jgi:signal transduction histidine kinase